jgi:hypothetical protein
MLNKSNQIKSNLPTIFNLSGNEFAEVALTCHYADGPYKYSGN